MTKRRPPAAALLSVVAVVAASFVVLVAWVLRDGSPDRPPAAAAPEIAATTSVEPRPVLFGDTARTSVDVVLDVSEIDPSSIQTAADFSPWEVVGLPERRVVISGDRGWVQTIFVLRCLSGACVPSGNFTVYQFAPARVSFARRSGRLSDEGSIEVPLPSMRVYTRLTETALAENPGAAPWRTDLVSLPTPSFRVAPATLTSMLLLAAVAAALGGLALAYLAWPRSERVAPQPPPLPPQPALSPLEQALILLENTVRVDGASEQRRALELVAEELEQGAWGDAALASTARGLAWSQGVPPVERTTELAARVRSVLDQAAQDGQQLNGDGDHA